MCNKLIAVFSLEKCVLVFILGAFLGFHAITLIANAENGCSKASFSEAPNSPFFVGSKPNYLATGDFNSDGMPDIVVSGSVLLNDGQGGFTFGGGVIGDRPTFVIDFNQDGFLDLLGTISEFGLTNPVNLALGDGMGNFTSGGTFGCGDVCMAAVAGDFNHDGKTDVAAINLDHGYLAVTLSGIGFTAYEIEGSPRSLVIGDFNLDENLDIAIGLSGFDGIQVFLGDGLGGFTPLQNSGGGGFNKAMVKGDFNEDGIIDLATADRDSMQAVVNIGDGTGNFIPTFYPAQDTPVSIDVGDFNLDNHLDIVVDNQHSDSLTILLGDGTGNFHESEGSPFKVGFNPISVVVADFNSDGKPDLATAHFSSSNLRIYLNTCVPPSVSINNISVTETNSGLSNANFTVTVDPPSETEIRVDYATVQNTAKAGLDFQAVNGTLVIPAGSTTGTITVPIIGDAIDESNEKFFVDLSSPVNVNIADSHGSCTIKNLKPTVVINDANVTEGNTGTRNAGFSVKSSFAYNVPISVNYSTAGVTAKSPSDYIATSGTLTIPANRVSNTIVVRVVGDTLHEGTETFKVNLSVPVKCTIGDVSAIGTISDNDLAPAISINDVSQAEGNSASANFTFTVKLSVISGLQTTVSAITANGTATAPGDYTSKTKSLTIPAGSISTTFIVSVKGDIAVEPSETFFVNLSSPTNATIADSQGKGTIQNDD